MPSTPVPPPAPPDPNDPRNQNPSNPITWIRLGGVIVVLAGGILIWQLNNGPLVPSTSPTPGAPGSPGPTLSTDEPGTFTVTFDGTSNLERMDPKAFATDEKSFVQWHLVFPGAPTVRSADPGQSTVTGTGSVTEQGDNGQGESTCNVTKWTFVNDPIMVDPTANRWGVGYGITIPAVYDDTTDPSKTCAAYDMYVPQGQSSWPVASFPMQAGTYTVGGPQIDYTADTAHWTEVWSGTITVTPAS